MKLHHRFLLPFLCLATAASAQIVPVAYDFNDYVNNSGTDGYEGSGHWTGSHGWTTSSPYGGSFYLSNTDSHDGSSYVRFTDWGPSVGATASTAGTFGSVRTDERFSFSFSYLRTNHWGTIVGISSALDFAGIAFTASTLNQASTASDLWLTLGENNLGSADFTYSSAVNWYDFRIDVDVGANGGSGLASVFSRVTGDTTWSPVSGLTSLNLGLDVTRTAFDPSNPLTWNTLWFHHEGAASGIDNLSVSAIPEPSTYAALGGATALALALWRRRSSVRTPRPC